MRPGKIRIIREYIAGNRKISIFRPAAAILCLFLFAFLQAGRLGDCRQPRGISLRAQWGALRAGRPFLYGRTGIRRPDFLKPDMEI